MSITAHTATFGLSFGPTDDTLGGSYWEGDVTVSYTFSPGCAATWDDPAEDDEVDNIVVTHVDGQRASVLVPDFLDIVLDAIESNDMILEHLAQEARDDNVGAYEDAMEQRHRDRTEDRDD